MLCCLCTCLCCALCSHVPPHAHMRAHAHTHTHIPPPQSPTMIIIRATIRNLKQWTVMKAHSMSTSGSHVTTHTNIYTNTTCLIEFKYSLYFITLLCISPYFLDHKHTCGELFGIWIMTHEIPESFPTSLLNTSEYSWQWQWHQNPWKNVAGPRSLTSSQL